MSKMTDRLSNQDIITLAKKQYETEKRSKLPSVIVPLTSKGLVYPENHLLREGSIEMRYMTAYDEDILTNISYRKNGTVFDKLLEAIILTPIDVKDINMVDKFGLIINARILAYGAEYAVTVTDSKTKKTYNRIIDLNKLNVKPFDLAPDVNGEFSYKVNDEWELKFKFASDDSLTGAVSEFLKKTITQVNDSRNSDDISNFIRYEFLSFDAKKFRTYVAENTPGIDLMIEFEGENGDTFKSLFPVGSELFWF
jgi:hypothetical protein